MISYLYGTVTQKDENAVIIDVNNVGYYVTMPSGDIAQIPEDSPVKVYTNLYIRETQPELYGFLNKEGIDWFDKLISISGVGPKAAIALLGTLAPRDLALAIISDDAKAITRAPGVGSKMAQRIILELKSKVDTAGAVSSPEKSMPSFGVSNQSEAVNALIALGASPSMAQKTVMQMDKNMSTEEIIREALRRMSNGI